MGVKNAVSKEYLSDNQRFAEVCNNQLFGGRPVIRPEGLRQLDPAEWMLRGVYPERTSVMEKYRDLLKVYEDRFLLLVIGIENQDEISYVMPLREMIYDVLEYEKQRTAMAKGHRRRGDLKGGELLSGMAKGERLLPVVSLVVYWGTKPWNAPKTLHEMLDIPPVLDQYKSVINDYRINILEVNSMDNLESYSGELKALFGFVKYQKDKGNLNAFVKENEDTFHNMTQETVRAVSVLGNSHELERYLDRQKDESQKEVIDVCQALEEMIMDGKIEGRKEGGMIALVEACQEFGITREATAEKLLAKFDVSAAEAEEYLAKYWK